MTALLARRKGFCGHGQVGDGSQVLKPSAWLLFLHGISGVPLSFVISSEGCGKTSIQLWHFYCDRYRSGNQALAIIVYKHCFL